MKNILISIMNFWRSIRAMDTCSDFRIVGCSGCKHFPVLAARNGTK